MIDERLVSALKTQLARAEGSRIGWKVGAGERERIGDDLVVGHLTSKTLLEPGSTYRGGGELHVDVEVAVEVGAGYGVALEIVDLGGTDDPEEIVAANIFHRAVAFGPMQAALRDGLEARATVNGEVRRSNPVDVDVDGRVDSVDRILRAVGEGLRPGDRVITGSLVQIPVRSGDEVIADIGPLGSVKLSIA
jgi:hypothetical protein